MPIYHLSNKLVFPSPELADESGILAVGGDLRPERLLLAYKNGIFPWYNDEEPIIWWSPPQRMVLYPNELKISKSMHQLLRKDPFDYSFDTSFRQVITLCRDIPRREQQGSWITEEMLEAYCTLHEQGFAHSLEVWQKGKLVGGLYGISLGRSFFGESMFSIVSNASKAAFVKLAEWCVAHDFHFIDCQVHNDHLASLGAKEVPRSDFLEALKKAVAYPTLRGNWKFNPL